MTEERQASNSISVLHSMLNRLKFSERLQSSSDVTVQQCRHLKDTSHCGSTFILESDKPKANFTESNLSECSVKPEGQNDGEEDLEHLNQRNVFQDSSPDANTIHSSRSSSNSLHNLIIDTRQNLLSSESYPLWDKVKEQQTSRAESLFTILTNNPPYGPSLHDPVASSLSNTESKFVKRTTVPMDNVKIKQPCVTENTVSL